MLTDVQIRQSNINNSTYFFNFVNKIGFILIFYELVMTNPIVRWERTVLCSCPAKR